MVDPCRVLSLCSGIGGLDLGIRLAIPGARAVCFVEREAFCASVLLARMEDTTLERAPVWCGDLREFDARPWAGSVDMVCAGYPCQPFSHAGTRAGTSDPRHLWPEVRRIITETGCGLVLLENVSGHLSLGFDEVCGELDGMGYRIAAGVFAASEVGAPHRRERLFVLAHRTGGGARDSGTRGAASEHRGHSGGDVAHRDEQRGLGQREVRDGERAALGHDADRCGAAMAHRLRSGRQQEPGSAHGDETAHEGRAAIDSDEPASGVEAMADAERGRHDWRTQDAERGPERGVAAERAGAAMEHANQERLQRPRLARGRRGGPESSGPREREVADRHGIGCLLRRDAEERGQGEPQPVAQPCGEHVEHAGLAGPQGRERAGALGERHGQAASRPTPEPSPLPWPPGPSDRAGWERVIAERPDLAPSLEPALRGVADGIPVRLVEAMTYRTERLQALGNGVVPAQAAYAIRVLAAELLGGG